MSWYKTLKNPIILWHATTPTLVEEIIGSGFIKSSTMLEKETGLNYQGWNFNQPGQIYGEGVYLAKTKSLAIYYATLRLREEIEQIEDWEDLYNEETYGYVAVFKVYIFNRRLLVPALGDFGKPTLGEYMYLGNIPGTKNNKVWFEGPEWIDKTKELREEINRKEQIIQELNPVISEQNQNVV